MDTVHEYLIRKINIRPTRRRLFEKSKCGGIRSHALK
jgi:hypothetical protein